MPRSKFIHCKFCERKLKDEESYAEHIGRMHKDMIIPGMQPDQFVYYLRTGRTHGSCVMCKKDTRWNPKTHKYHRFCDNPKCKEEYREIFKKRMIDHYGKVCLLNDPEQQKKMLANRSISGVYLWSNRKDQFHYTGSYELDFLLFLDHTFDFDPTDLMMPSPHTFFYVYEGKKHFYIPDAFIPSLNLEIEIKDGGDNPNKHPKIVAVDKEKERLKDKIMKSKDVPFNYVKIVNKDYMKFFHYLEIAKEQDRIGSTEKIYLP